MWGQTQREGQGARGKPQWHQAEWACGGRGAPLPRASNDVTQYTSVLDFKAMPSYLAHSEADVIFTVINKNFYSSILGLEGKRKTALY